jgi:hypothetical protein
MYRVRQDGSLKTQGEIRQAHPNTSFPKTWSPELVNELGLDPVFDTPQPTTTRYQTASHDGVEQIDGKWCWKWKITEMDAEQKAALDAQQAAAVRSTRDARLAETDWVVIKNLELNQNIPGIWEVYRQNLRDIPTQAGFPWDITWPTKPE